MRTAYFNGHFVPESEAKLSIYDLSVMQSAAAFEMTRSFNGKHFKLKEHLQRLHDSCKLLSIPLNKMPFRGTFESIIDEVTRLNDHGPGEEHRLLIVVSPGCAPMYNDLAGVIPHPFVYIADFPLSVTTRGLARQFRDGGSAIMAHTAQISNHSVHSHAKHRSRLHFHLAQCEAAEKHADWAFMTDMEGHLAECPGANIFIVRKGKIYTPWRNCLQGISRQTVCLILEKAVEAEDIPYVWMSEAEEVFVTGTPFCMLPVVSLDGKPIGDGTPGPVYKETLRKWSELVGIDIQQQIVQWDAPSTLWTPEKQRAVTA
jgi:branched-chain amino acid aminotransferase